MIKRVLLTMIILVYISPIAFAGQYIGNNKITYIGETDKYFCYAYDYDVNFAIRFSDFGNQGNWSVTVALEPKTEQTRQNAIALLKEYINTDSLNTILLPVKSDVLWAFAARFSYDNISNQLFMQNNFWLNEYGEIIGMNKFAPVGANSSEYPSFWEVQKLINTHVQKRYQEEQARQNTIIR